MKQTKPSIDPLKGVNKPEALIGQLRHLKNGTTDGKTDPRGFIKGSLQWLERHPPNKKIVPFLQAVLKKY